MCLTGHRYIAPDIRKTLKARLKDTVRQLYDRGYRLFLCGGALGFDTLGAQAVLELRDELPGLRLKMVLPCRSQSSRWAPADQAVYTSILARADRVIWLSDSYYKGCMLMRNRYLVAHSSLCLCYLEDRRGGTLYTVGCAVHEGLEVINLALPA